MVTALLIVLTVFGVAVIAVMVAARELELRQEKYGQYTHPPDRREDDHEQR